MRQLLLDWDVWFERLSRDVDAGRFDTALDWSAVHFHPPVPDPPNVFMTGGNYRDHLQEIGIAEHPNPETDEPFMFLRSPSTLIGCHDDVTLPSFSGQADWELEL